MVREPKFNLLDEPWLEATTRAGNVQRLGILECLRRSAELRGLGQDMSTQRFVVLRLLLAFLHRAMGGPTTTAWNRAWKDGLPQEAIDAYADQVRDRFWLVHPSQPFFQTPTSSRIGLRPTSRDSSGQKRHCGWSTLRGTTLPESRLEHWETRSFQRERGTATASLPGRAK